MSKSALAIVVAVLAAIAVVAIITIAIVPRGSSPQQAAPLGFAAALPSGTGAIAPDCRGRVVCEQGWFFDESLQMTCPVNHQIMSQADRDVFANSAWFQQYNPWAYACSRTPAPGETPNFCTAPSGATPECVKPTS